MPGRIKLKTKGHGNASSPIERSHDYEGAVQRRNPGCQTSTSCCTTEFEVKAKEFLKVNKKSFLPWLLFMFFSIGVMSWSGFWSSGLEMWRNPLLFENFLHLPLLFIILWVGCFGSMLNLLFKNVMEFENPDTPMKRLSNSLGPPLIWISLLAFSVASLAKFFIFRRDFQDSSGDYIFPPELLNEVPGAWSQFVVVRSVILFFMIGLFFIGVLILRGIYNMLKRQCDYVLHGEPGTQAISNVTHQPEEWNIPVRHSYKDDDVVVANTFDINSAPYAQEV